MTTFLALYRGRTVAEAKMVAVTADPVLVATVAAHLLDTPPHQDEDPVVTTLDQPFPSSLQAQCSRGQRHWPFVNLDAKIPPDVNVLIFS